MALDQGTVSLCRLGSPLLEFYSWGSCSLWFYHIKNKNSQEHFFVPSIYDSGVTFIASQACERDSNSTCPIERGTTAKLEDVSSLVEEPVVSGQSPYFAPETWRSLWSNSTSDSSNSSRTDKYGSVDVETLSPSYKLESIPTKAIRDASHFSPSIGLAPLDSDFNPDKGGLKSFIYHMKQSAKLKSTSWSYTDSMPFTGTELKNSTKHFGLDVPSSLIIGGYDENRCNFSRPDTARFKFSRKERPYDHFRIPTMQIQANSTTTNPTNFQLQDVLIDTATPFLWLPADIYNSIADILGAKTNSTFGTEIIARNLGDYGRWRTHEVTVSLVIPSSITDSQVVIKTTPPGIWKVLVPPFEDTSEKISTIPIAKLPQNQTTPVLGLAFFTYACMLANYDDETFAIMPQQLRYDGATKLTTIDNAFSGKLPPKPQNKRLLIGLSILIACLVVFTALLGFFMRRRQVKRRAIQRQQIEAKIIEEQQQQQQKQQQEQQAALSTTPELDSPQEVVASVEKDGSGIDELGGVPMSELHAPMAPVEIDGRSIKLESTDMPPQYHGDSKARP